MSHLSTYDGFMLSPMSAHGTLLNALLSSGQVDVGELSPVQMNKGYFCEYWINPRFQTCLKLENSESKNIFLIEGQYYERGEGGSSKGIQYMLIYPKHPVMERGSGTFCRMAEGCMRVSLVRCTPGKSRAAIIYRSGIGLSETLLQGTRLAVPVRRWKSMVVRKTATEMLTSTRCVRVWLLGQTTSTCGRKRWRAVAAWARSTISR